MKNTIYSSWPLLVGIVLIMIGNGLQGTLLSVRATIEGFSIMTTGIVMSMYYAGYVMGSVFAPRMLENVGHIRVFAALASLASASVLLHFIFIDPWIWGATRIVTGFAYAGLYVVIESWLNGMATNNTRGKILSFYMFLVYLGMVIGQLMMKVASPEGVELFVLTSVLVSLALLPISLSRRKAPEFEIPERLQIKKLMAISPLGVVGAAMAGFMSAALFTIGPVFATNIGMDVSDVANFMAIMVLGGMILQYPIGNLSDKIDRRKVMALCMLAGAVTALGCQMVTGDGQGWLFLVCAFLFWGLSTPLYALAASHTNDYIDRNQIVAASSSLILLNGMGAAFGPTVFSVVINWTGDDGFFGIFAAIYSVLGLYVLYRISRRPPVSDEDKVAYVNMPARGTPVVAQMVEEMVAESAYESGADSDR